MRVLKTALQRAWSWLSPARSAQLAPTAINPAPAKPGTRELAALHAIRVLRDNAYTALILEEIRRVTKREIGWGTVAMSLDWLEEHDCVTVREAPDEFERGGRKRRYFTLTPKGEEALRG
jgi:PadR family transcriptional regulator, regulatory protein PadR